MPTPSTHPFQAFKFAVEIRVDDEQPTICSAAFAECDGLEMTMDVKTVREGGNNGQQIHLNGPVSYGQLSLKRGMTRNFDLWRWWSRLLVAETMALRADAHIVVYERDGVAEAVRFHLKRCLPTKLKAPALNAKDGIVAIEELQLAYEALEIEAPGGGGGVR
ncbi:MAG: phage tail protein [Myxococcales bacterium]|nr:phage tail protein [Myxococcales bacterium]